MRAASQFTTDTVLETLRLTRLWATASSEVLQRAAERVEVLQFPDGELLIRQGERCEAVHVIVEGSVEVRVLTEDGAENTLCALGEGESIGEMSLLTGEPASANVVAVGRAATLAIAASDFTEIVASHPALLRQVVRILARRLSETDTAVGEARGKEQDLTQMLREGDEWGDEVLGSSAAVRKLRKSIDVLAEGTAPVLIRGEDGTRRAVAARLLHNDSERRAALVVGLDCTEVVETPWGDQLFSAPGARAAHGSALCYMELVDGGTLILKNLERLPPKVQDRMTRYLREGHPEFDVRILATCPEAEVAERGRIRDELLACFEDRVLVVPPLRERKRDIPLLAERALEKHTYRLGKKIRSFSDPALTRLVSYDYRIGNDRELEQAVERAVILTESPVIEAETLFLGPPPPPRHGALNVLAIPGLDARRLARWLPRVLRAATVLFFAFILVQAFFGPRGEDGNLATTLVWTLWWPGLVLSFFFAGRLWCGMCPMSVATKMGDRLGTNKRRIPTWLKQHDTGIAMAGLLLIVLVEEMTGMRHSPVATGLLLLAILGGAAITGLLLPRRTWCRHICPLGGLAGACATSGLLELRPTYDICAAKCTGHACYKGDESTAGCPMFNHVMFVDTNQHCVLCMNCVQSCPNGSPQLNLRLPGREIWGGSASKPDLGLFVLMLVGLIAGLALIQHLERVGHEPLSGGARPWLVGAIVLAGAALPLLLAWPFRRRAERRGKESARAFWDHVVALTPLVTAGLVAYQMEYLPGLGAVDANLQATHAGATEAWISIPLLSLFRLVVLAGGLAVTIILMWRARARVRQNDPEGEARRRGGAAWLAATVGYGALLLVLMLGR